MIYTQQSHLPIIFQVDEGIFLNISSYLERNKLLFTRPLVVSGQSMSSQYAKQISVENNWLNYLLESNTSIEVEKLKEFTNNNNIDLIIAVGGGKVIDTVKRVSYLTNVNNLSVPTIISNDGLISPVAVIKNEFGKTESLPGMMPMGVVLDIDIITNSPSSFLRAALGDVLSNISATNDWILAFKADKERMNDIAYHLSKSAANTLVYSERFDVKHKPFLRLVVQGLINSGIAMSLAGTSRPCSGSEHLISHALDNLNLSKSTLHGTQVGSISLFSLYLQGKLEHVHLKFAKNNRIPLDFAELMTDFNKEIFYELINKAREMRPGRYTILDDLDNEKLYEQYIKYSIMVSNTTI